MKIITPTLITAILFFCCQHIFSQPVIIGEISVQNSQTETGTKQYVKNADVSADSANPAVSNDSGTFILEYYKKNIGDETLINISKAGLDVVNKDRLNTYIPSDPSVHLDIYMCESGKLAETILKFRGIAKEQITFRFAQRIAKLENEKNKNQYEILKLEEEKDIALVQFNELAKKLAVVNLDNEPLVYTKAYQAFSNNLIEEARRIIKEADLDTQLKELRASKELGMDIVQGAERGINGIANTYMLEAQLALVDLDFNAAFESYDKAIQANDTLNLNHNLEFAIMLHAQYELERAIEIYTKSLELSKDNLHLYAYNEFLLSSVLTTRNELHLAIDHMEKAKITYETLIEKGMDKYKPFLAVTCAMLNAICLLHGDLERAGENAEMSIELFKNLANENPERYEPYLLWSRIAGNLFLTEQEVDSLIIQSRRLSNRNGEYSSLLSVALFIKALRITAAGQGQLTIEDNINFQDQIYEYIEEAFAIAEDQIKAIHSSSAKYNVMINNSDSIPNLNVVLAHSENKTGMLFTFVKLFSGMSIWMFSKPDVNSKFWKISRQTLDVSVKKCEELMKLNKDRYTPHYLEFATMLGLFHSIEGDNKKALELLQSSYIQTRPLYLKDTQTYEILHATNRAFYFLSHALYYLRHSSFYDGMNRETLMQVLIESRNVLGKYENMPMMSMTVPMLDEWEICLMREHYPELLLFRSYQETENLARQSLERNDYLNSLYYANVSLRVLEKLNRLYFNVEDANTLVSKYDGHINLFYEIEELDSVIVHAKNQIDIMERISLANTESVAAVEYPTICGNSAWFLSIMRDFEGAIKYSKKGLQADPSQSWIYTNLALGYFGRGDWDSALRIYAEFYSQKFPENDKTKFRDIFIQDLDSLAYSGFESDLYEKARKFLKHPSKAPEDLKNGLQLLKEANNVYHEGVSNNNAELLKKAMLGYEELIKSSGFHKYFKNDFKPILLNLANCYKALGKEISFNDFGLSHSTLIDIAEEINRDVLLIHKYASEKDYNDIIFKMKTAILLTRQAKELSDNEENYNNLLIILNGNIATYYMFNNQLNLALKSVENGLLIDSHQSWLQAKLLECYVLMNNMNAAKEVFTEFRDTLHFKYDIFAKFAARLSYDFYCLRKYGIDYKSINEAIELFDLHK